MHGPVVSFAAVISGRLRPAAVLLAVVLALLPLLADAAPGTTRIDWGTPAPMPTLRQNFGLAAAANGKLYAVGGATATGARSALVEEYDPATNTWTTKAPMPTAREGLGLAAHPNGKLYAVGGATATGARSALVEEYDPATNTWTTKAPMPTPRLSLVLVTASNGKLYAVTGIPSSGGVTDAVEEYDPVTNTWAIRAPIPTARVSLGLAAHPNGKLYAVGGFTFNVLAAVEEYDPVTNTWTTKAPMPTARRSLGLAAHPNGKLYAVGGHDGNNVLAAVEEYDPATNTWAVKAPMPTGRRLLGLAAAANGKLYAVAPATVVVGGPAIVEEYDPASDTWSAALVGAAMPTGRFSLGLATGVNGRLYAIGGFAGASYLAVNEEYDPSANSWRARAAMPGGPRRGLGAVAHPNGLIYAVGGADSIAYLGRTEAYNPATNTWQGGLDDLNTPREGLGVAVGSDGLVYAVGGYDGTDRTTVEAYNPATNTWTNRQSLNVARQLPALVATPDGSLYAIGGFSGTGGPVPFVERYSIATNTWTLVPPMNTARYGLSAILGPNGRIYAVGGRVDATTFLDVVEEYDPATGTWRTVGPMPTARAGFGLALGPDKRAFAVGGYAGGPGLAGLTVVEELRFTEVPSASAGGPYGGPADTSIQLNGAGSDPEGAGLSYAWDLNDDLLYETPGQAPTFSAVGLAGGVRTVRMRAIDDRGAYAVASTTLTITGASRLQFSTQPGGAQVGQPLAPQPVVQVVDAGGIVVPSYTGPVTMAFGTNAGGGNLGGTVTVNAVNGVATFTNLFVTAPGDGYTLIASSGALTTATSAPFDITPPPRPPAFCSPRPPVRVQATRSGGGQLSVTVTAQTSTGTPVNPLQRIAVTRADNGAVSWNGSQIGAGQSVTFPAGTIEVTLLVRRLEDGRLTTVAFTATDICGEWPSFVGGGPGAF